MSRDPKELLDLLLDGGLDADQQSALRSAAAATPELATEERELRRLHELLATARVQAPAGFRAAVLATLPAEPPWAAPRLGGWRIALAALAALLTVTVGLLLLGGARLGGGSPTLATLHAIADFATAAALSGSGLLSASWRGVGMAVAAALSLPGRVVFGIGVVALDALLLVLLRRPRRRRLRALAVARPRG